jgi:hypothetical protein
MNSLEQLKAQFDASVAEYEKFAKGNSAAGTRARKALGELAKVCKTIRNEVTAEKNARKEAKEQGK